MKERLFRANFGLPSFLVEKVWQRLCQFYLLKPFQPKHLLWCLYFLKISETSWENSPEMNGIMKEVLPRLSEMRSDQLLEIFPHKIKVTEKVILVFKTERRTSNTY